MTKELFNAVSRAFKNDENPTYAVAIDDAERVYIVAELFESYRPTMPKGRRNNGFLCAGIFELKDTGKGYCTVKPIQTFGRVAQAKAQFESFAQDMQLAENERTLKALLENVTVNEAA